MLKVTLSYSRIASLSRLAFASYMLIYFVCLLISNEILFIYLRPQVAQILKIAFGFGCLCVLGTVNKRIYLPCLFLIWIIFIQINNLVYSLFQLHNSFVGLIVVLLMLVPFSNGKNEFSKSDVDFFKKVQFLTLGLLSLSYTVSGFAKMLFPGWLSGEVSTWLVEHFSLRPHIVFYLGGTISKMGKLFTWPVLFMETLPFFIFLFKRSRSLAWLLGVVLQITLITFFQLTQISSFLLIVHLLTFDPAWLKITD